MSRAAIGRSFFRASASIFTSALMLGCAVTGGEEETDRGSQAACSAPAYVGGTAYKAGDRVTAGGKTYECKPYPYSGWCSIAASYSPGTGFAWRDAWTEITSCGTTTGGTGTGTGTGTTTCSGSADWVAGQWYKTGDIVRFSGAYYVAEHDNPGYDPTISTWFWDPKTCSTSGGSTGGTSTGTTTCSGSTDWVAGQWYTTGNIVKFNGAYYVAEHDNPGYDPTISTWFWDPKTCSSTGGSTGGTGTGTTTGTGLASILSKATFESMFPGRNGFYTYEGLVEATKKYPAFATTGSVDARKREIAAFLANVNHETGALVYVEEIAKGDYTDWGSSGCAPEAGKRYYGRGPIQLSWNYNYCAASRSIFGDQEVLRRDPDRVAREAWVAWATGIWYWMTSTGPGTMTCHDAMANDRGFGETIRSINGSLECGGRNPTQVNSRIDAYRRFCSMLGVDPGGNLTC
jgi:predicted chitinase